MASPPPPPPPPTTSVLADKKNNTLLLENIRHGTGLKKVLESEKNDRSSLTNSTSTGRYSGKTPTLAEAIKAKQESMSKDSYNGTSVSLTTSSQRVVVPSSSPNIDSIHNIRTHSSNVTKLSQISTDVKILPPPPPPPSTKSNSLNRPLQPSSSILLTGSNPVPNNLPPPPPVPNESKKSPVIESPSTNIFNSVNSDSLHQSVSQHTPGVGESRKTTPPQCAPPPPPPTSSMPGSLASPGRQLQDLTSNAKIPVSKSSLPNKMHTRNDFDARFKFVEASTFPDPNVVLKRTNEVI